MSTYSSSTTYFSLQADYDPGSGYHWLYTTGPKKIDRPVTDWPEENNE